MATMRVKKAERKTPSAKRSGTATGSSKRAIKAPKEPNLFLGKAGLSGAPTERDREGGRKEKFGTGTGNLLSAKKYRGRVPADKGKK